MQEHEYQQPISPERLLTVVEELERGLESLTAAVAEVRMAIALMGASPQEMAPPLMIIAEQLVAVAPPSRDDEAADDDVAERERARQAVEKAKREASWLSMPVDSGLGFGARPAPEVKSDDAEAATRAEVRRLVEEASMGALEQDESAAIDEAAFDNFEAVIAVEAEVPLAETAVEAILETTIAEAREEIAEAAEEAEPETASQTAAEDSEFLISQPPVADYEAAASYEETVAEVVGEPQPEEDEEAARAQEVARREQVRLSVEAVRAEMMGAEAQHEPEPEPVDDDARREAVRRAVAEARNQMDWGSIKVDSGGSWGQFKPEPGGFTIRPEELAPSAAQMANNETTTTEAADDGAPVDDDEARREAVRRAVEAARAEMFHSEEPEEERPRIAPVLPRRDAMPKGADFSGPPLIVIEDAEGRVELSQVFATLSKVNRSSQAALLNYSPHSVTIGLNMLSPVPEARELIEAAQAVFGRECSVKTEGSRTAIEIGSRQLR